MTTNAKILQRMDRMDEIMQMYQKEAAMLKQELSGVVSGSSPKRGKKEQKPQVAKATNRRAQKRVRE